MGLGILSDPHLGDNIPGTSLLDDFGSKIETDDVFAKNTNLKRSQGGIILIPQPSSSPDDPLNWPLWRKIAMMFTLTYGAGVVGAMGPIISAGSTKVATSLHTSVNSLSKMTGDLCLATGLVLILTAPASVIFGRRPIYLFASALLLVSSIWSTVAKDLNSLVASRVIGGMGMAPIECLVEATIADIFFVHERGLWISIWSFASLGGISGVSIVNGYLIQYVSWRVCFLIQAILCGILFLLTIFFVPETAFVRGEIPVEKEAVSVEDQKIKSEVSKEDACKPSYWRSLSPWTGQQFSEESFWKLVLRPVTLLCSPVVAWGTFIYAATHPWTVALSVSISLLFSSPAYGYDFPAGPVGLISGIGPLIGAILGNALAGPLSDWSVTWLSRRNGGIYEPELFMIVPMLITTTISWFGWAISAYLRELWIGPAIFYSLWNFGLSVGNVGILAYVVDAHGHYAAETFAIINLVKNLFMFGVTYFFVPWLNSQGVLRTFCIIGGINIVANLTAVPMYIYGKRARSWVCRTGLMQGTIQV